MFPPSFISSILLESFSVVCVRGQALPESHQFSSIHLQWLLSNLLVSLFLPLLLLPRVVLRYGPQSVCGIKA